MEGGKPDFHSEKKISRLLTRVGHDMYNLENREENNHPSMSTPAILFWEHLISKVDWTNWNITSAGRFWQKEKKVKVIESNYDI